MLAGVVGVVASNIGSLNDQRNSLGWSIAAELSVYPQVALDMLQQVTHPLTRSRSTDPSTDLNSPSLLSLDSYLNSASMPIH